MPLYEYFCKACSSSFDVKQSFADEPLTTCIQCGVEDVHRVIFAPTIIDATPKTLGSVADRNEGPGRSYWIDAMRSQSGGAGCKPAATRPWWRDSDTVNTRLATLTPEQKQNYVLHGHTDPLTPTISSASPTPTTD